MSQGLPRFEFGRSGADKLLEHSFGATVQFIRTDEGELEVTFTVEGKVPIDDAGEVLVTLAHEFRRQPKDGGDS
jgi:hypothetical protein